MIEYLQNIDQQVFLFLNGLHVDWLDPIMIFISGILTWLPFHLILIYLVIRKFGWKSLIVFAAITVLITLTDQISVHAFKNVFMRLRPCHTESIQDLVYLPSGRCGGKYSFVSSHATNYFGVAMFLWLLLRNYYSKIGYILFIWATIIAYSRIYLGVHFTGDVIVGAMLGMLIGFLVWKLFQPIRKKYLIESE